LIHQQPKNEWLWLNKGLLASLQNRNAETVQAWNTLLDLNPDHLQGHLFLSEWYEKQGKLGAATVHAEAAFASHPNSLEAENRVIHLRQLNP
jgi:predicted Zn-dependent protease